jgi:gamma-glutamyltranspeptidase
MSPGDLLLDERTAPAVIEELIKRGHKVETRSRWNSGAAPVLVRVTPGGVFEAGADPWGFRSMRAN